MIWLAVEKLGCLPDELLRRLDEQYEHGITPLAGSQQLAELIAEFGLQHDEYEERNAKQDAAAEAERRQAEKQPLWRRVK